MPLPVSRSLLVVIDEDSAFCLRLRVCLEQYADLELAVEDADGSKLVQMLENARGFSTNLSEGTLDLPSVEEIALIILNVNLGRSHPSQLQGLSLCQRIKGQYPNLPVLLITASPNVNQLNAAHQAGANGYCAKALPSESLVAIIRRVAGGQNYWMPFQSSALLNSSQFPQQAVSSSLRTPRTSIRSSIWENLRTQLQQSSVHQIDVVMNAVVNELENGNLSLLDRAIIAGKYRELRAARWLVTQLLTPNGTTSEASQPFTDEPPVRSISDSQVRRLPENSHPSTPNPPIASSSAIATQPAAFIEQVRDLRSLLFDSISTKLQTNLENLTETPLETDILREDKKRELFYLILRKIEDLLGELTYSQVQAVQLQSKQPDILQDLWQAIVTDFFGKYYTVPLAGMDVEVVDVLLQDGSLIQTAILEKIPGVSELLKHLLFQAPLEIDSAMYAPGNPEALARAEALLENWMIQMANAVMQPLLNRFANAEVIKQTFYDRRLLSIRDIERFRNDLSWRYRLEQFFREPTDIFESKHHLLVFSGRGIRRTAIYAIRYQELDQLEGIPRAITLALEARDAIAPRLRSVVSLVGNGVVYVLTEVIGRGIGLVGRGVLKGLGNIWQDNRFSRK